MYFRLQSGKELSRKQQKLLQNFEHHFMLKHGAAITFYANRMQKWTPEDSDNVVFWHLPKGEGAVFLQLTTPLWSILRKLKNVGFKITFGYHHWWARQTLCACEAMIYHLEDSEADHTRPFFSVESEANMVWQ